jgi:RNA recognition motif. (a.k.a. RRM, RBD, or RNP domain)
MFIGNIPHESSRDDILAFCERAGSVHKLYVPAPKAPGARNAGYAFAMYESRVAAAEALEQLAGKSMAGATGSRPIVRALRGLLDSGHARLGMMYAAHVPQLAAANDCRSTPQQPDCTCSCRVLEACFALDHRK